MREFERGEATVRACERERERKKEGIWRYTAPSGGLLDVDRMRDMDMGSLRERERGDIELDKYSLPLPKFTCTEHSNIPSLRGSGLPGVDLV